MSTGTIPDAMRSLWGSPRAVDVKTVFCDFDGPIMDVSDRYYHTYLQGLEDVQSHYAHWGVHFPIHPLSKEQFWQMKQDRTPDQEIALRSGLYPEEQVHFFLHRVQEIVNQPTLLQRDQLQPGVRWALTLLQAQGVRLVLVTLRCQRQVTQLLKQHQLFSLFHAVWGADDCDAAYRNQAQHKSELLHRAWHQSSHHRDRGAAWMIGDTEADVIAGQSLGIPTLALTCGIRSRSYLEQFDPTRIHRDLLSAAHYLANLSSIA